ncbi:hypothetical protein GCM10017687_35220 [Streptomyces echinatus]
MRATGPLPGRPARVTAGSSPGLRAFTPTRPSASYAVRATVRPLVRYCPPDIGYVPINPMKPDMGGLRWPGK